MCYVLQKRGCRYPEKLKKKPTNCTPQQIKKCHGSVRRHPCLPKKNKRK